MRASTAPAAEFADFHRALVAATIWLDRSGGGVAVLSRADVAVAFVACVLQEP